MRGKLSVSKVRTAGPGEHRDGGGLMLIVSEIGAKSWVLRTTIHGVQRDVGLGPTWRVSLADARSETRRLRTVARSAGDPLMELEYPIGVVRVER